MAAPTYPTTGVQRVPGQKGAFYFDNNGPQAAMLPYNVGTFVANGTSTVTIADTNVTTTSDINITLKTVGGTPSNPVISTITAGTGFTVTCGSGDTSTYTYSITG